MRQSSRSNIYLVKRKDEMLERKLNIRNLAIAIVVGIFAIIGSIIAIYTFIDDKTVHELEILDAGWVSTGGGGMFAIVKQSGTYEEIPFSKITKSGSFLHFFLTNTNHMDCSIKRVYATVIKFETYDSITLFDLGAGGSDESQLFSGKIEPAAGDYELHYIGQENNTNNISNNRYVKLTPNEQESINVYIAPSQLGIYYYKLNIEYVTATKRYVYTTPIKRLVGVTETDMFNVTEIIEDTLRENLCDNPNNRIGTLKQHNYLK